MFFGDRLVNSLPPEKRNLAMVFQSYALYPHKTIGENIAFPLRLRKVPSEQIKKKVLEVAEMLGITHLLDRKPGALSGGQRQRVALGRALCREADVYLLDEPLSNLDAKLRVQMRAEIKRLHQDFKMTMVYVTHDQSEAMTLSDRVAILDKGILQQCAPPREIYNHPANQFVAGFVGSPSMNFFEVELYKSDNGYGLRMDSYNFEINGDWGYKAIQENGAGKIILGIRPEDIFISHNDGEVDAKVYVIEPMGNLCWVNVDFGHYRLMGQATSDFETEPGSMVKLNFSKEKFHLFHYKSRIAIKV